VARLRLQSFQQVPVTSGLLALNVVIWLGQISPVGYLFTNQMFFAPLFAPFEPWRMLTAGFVHDWTGPFHILLNSYAILDLRSHSRATAGSGSILGDVSNRNYWRLSSRDVAVRPPGAGCGGIRGTVWSYGRLFHCCPLHRGQFHPIFTLIAINFGLGFFCFWNLLGGPFRRPCNWLGNCRNLLAD